jgi:hypothetical protein
MSLACSLFESAEQGVERIAPLSASSNSAPQQQEMQVNVESIVLRGARVSSIDLSSEDSGLVIGESERDVMHFARSSNTVALLSPGVQRKNKIDQQKQQLWQQSSSKANRARLKVGDDLELSLKGMQVNIKVDGFRASVVIDHYFYNQDVKQFEGDFKFRLPDGASPFFFAFGRAGEQADIVLTDKRLKTAGQHINLEPDALMAERLSQWSAPKVARMAPRDVAANAYRQTVAKRVDPALLEWSGSGVYAAKVFPLIGKTLHRIVLGYDVDLTKTVRQPKSTTLV